MILATNKMQQNLFIDSFKLALHVSGDGSSIFRSTLTVYTAFWNNARTVLPTGDTHWMVPSNLSPVGSRQHNLYIVPESSTYSKIAPEDGRNCRSRHVQQA
jgi:hypothetical protein